MLAAGPNSANTIFVANFGLAVVPSTAKPGLGLGLDHWFKPTKWDTGSEASYLFTLECWPQVVPVAYYRSDTQVPSVRQLTSANSIVVAE